MWVVTVACFGVYLALSLGRWIRQAAPSWDLAIFEQAIKGWAFAGAPVIDIKGPGMSALGDHFSPLLVVLAPFYRLFPSPVTLLVAQCVLVALSIPPIMVTARRCLGARPGILLGIAFGLSWGFQSGIDVQFHEYCLAVPLLAYSLWALMSGRWVLSAVLAVLLLGVKEDLGLTVAAIGALMAATDFRRTRQSPGPHRQVTIGVTTAVIGLLGTVLIVFVIIPAFSPQKTWSYWGRLTGSGTDLSQMTGVGSVLGNLPHLLTTFLTPAVKVNTLVMLAALSLGSCVLSRLSLLAVPTLVWRFLSPDQAYWDTSWHYSMILMPIVFMGSIDALQRLNGSASPTVRAYARRVPVLACVFGLLTCVAFSLKDIVAPANYAPPPRAGEAATVLALIPASSSVATDSGLITQLVTHHTVYWLGSLRGVVPDYVLIDPQAGWGTDPGDPAQLAEAYYPDTTFTTVYSQATSGDPNGYRLAKHTT